MKRIKIIIYILFVLVIWLCLMSLDVNGQTTEDHTYQTSGVVDATPYVKAMSSNFGIDTLCTDHILVTTIGPRIARNKYVSKKDIKTHLYKTYKTKSTDRFALHAETNNGYVLVIGQYPENSDIAIRFFTLFVNQMFYKISVIEIEENK